MNHNRYAAKSARMKPENLEGRSAIMAIANEIGKSIIIDNANTLFFIGQFFNHTFKYVTMKWKHSIPV